MPVGLGTLNLQLRPPLPDAGQSPRMAASSPKPEGRAANTITTEILDSLAEIERTRDVRILYAAEAGSRAWGFESPDSDYDVRFIYVHPRNWYLSLREQRDVIEQPLTGLLDVSGWDLCKALRLFGSSNPALYEWLLSPIVYTESGTLAKELRALATSSYSHRALAWHYYRMAERNYDRYIRDGDKARLKKYLYVIRPLVMIYWMAACQALPPIHLETALAGLDLPASFRAALDNLLDSKRRTPELGEGPRAPELDQWIEESLRFAEQYCSHAQDERPSIQKLDAIYRINGVRLD